MELQQHQPPLGGGYGLYRSPYGNTGSGQESPGAFPGQRGHLGGYPFPGMGSQAGYGGYHHLGYPTSTSPGREGRKI